MSLKDIFEWIINVNLFYVIGAVVAWQLLSYFAREFPEAKKTYWDSLDNWKDKLGLLWVIFILGSLAYIFFDVIREEYF